MKILVIDDEHAVRYSLTRLLERHGFAVVTATDGQQGMLSLRDEQPDAVITDIIMPEQEGLETIRLIRRDMPDIKILAISGGGRVVDRDFLEVARKLGADDVLYKPLEPRDLLLKLDRLFATVGEPRTSPGRLGSYDA